MRTLRNGLALLVLISTFAYATSFNGVSISGVSFDSPPPAGVAPADWCADSSAIFCLGFGQTGITKTNNAATGSSYNVSSGLGAGFQGSGCLGPSPSCYDTSVFVNDNASLGVSGRGCVYDSHCTCTVNGDCGTGGVCTSGQCTAGTTSVCTQNNQCTSNVCNHTTAGDINNLCTGNGTSIYGAAGCCASTIAASSCTMAGLCTAPGTPFACCTGSGTGSGCATGGATFCTGAGTANSDSGTISLSCCTGSGAGTCRVAIPCAGGQSDCGNGTGNTVGGTCVGHAWPAYASCNFTNCSLLQTTGTGGATTKFTAGCAAKFNDVIVSSVLFGNTASSGTGKGWLVDRHLGGSPPEYTRYTLSDGTTTIVFNSDQTLWSHCVGSSGGTGSGTAGTACSSSAECLGICTGMYHVAITYDQSSTASLSVVTNGVRSPAAGPATKVCGNISGATGHNKVCTSDVDCNNVSGGCLTVPALLAADGAGANFGGSTPATSANGQIDQCWAFDNIALSLAGICRIQRCGPDGANCRCDSTTPANYKTCASNLDCGGGVCDLVSGSPTNGKCAGNPVGICAGGTNANQTCTANGDCPLSACTVCSPTTTCNAASPS